MRQLFSLRSLFALLSLRFAAVCAAQSPAPPQSGLEVPVGILHAIALDFDQRHDALYCYFGSRAVTPAVRVHVDSVTTVKNMDACGGVGLGFIVRSTDRLLLGQMAQGVIQNNPRFEVVSVFYATEDIDRYGDTVRVARPLSILRGVALTLTAGSPSR